METTKRVLVFQGGWDGHEPALVAKRFAAMMEKHGYSCEVSDSQEVLADREKLMAMDLIVPCWTMGEISGRRNRSGRLPRGNVRCLPTGCGVAIHDWRAVGQPSGRGRNRLHGKYP